MLFDSWNLFLAVASVLAVVFWQVYTRQWLRGRRLPPGPRGLPIVGNAFDIPEHYQWLGYTEWSKRYGRSAQLL